HAIKARLHRIWCTRDLTERESCGKDLDEDRFHHLSASALPASALRGWRWCFCCGKWRSVVIASQIERKTRRSIGFRLCRLRAAVARSRSVAEAAASARGRCTMPPLSMLSCSLVALAVQLVHRWDTPLWLI